MTWNDTTGDVVQIFGTAKTLVDDMVLIAVAVVKLPHFAQCTHLGSEAEV